MPTKPTHKKHGKAYLDEAVAKSTHRRKPITRNRAITAGILALPMGCLGMHDIILHNIKRGLIHAVISSIAFGMFLIPLTYAFMVIYKCKHDMGCDDIHGYDDTLNAVLITGIVLFAASVIWGIVEGIIILTHLDRFTEK
ncbi:MAG: hypothetical protein MJ154_00650 [Candidatus Saccharibacteria bacterium]|nr:hypothetical protein [Candidatus Saccharibacteria bacterium]